jgi:peptidylprolyl isomerase
MRVVARSAALTIGIRMPNPSRRLTLGLFVLLSAGAADCMASNSIADSSAVGSDVVAQARGIALGENDVRSLIADLPITERSTISGNLSSLEQLVHADLVRRAMLAELKGNGFDRQPETIAQLQGLRDQQLLRLWIASEAKVPADYPSEAEIQAAYTANQKALAAPTQYHLAQIFIAAPDGGDPIKLAAALSKAAGISSRIGSADFAQLARQLSEDTQSASRGGDLGTLPEDRLLPAIVAAVSGLQPGQVVGPIKTSQGLHFLKLVDKKGGAVPSLAEIHERLAGVLRAQRANQLQQAYLSAYDAKLGVTINQIELAKLQGSLPR